MRKYYLSTSDEYEDLERGLSFEKAESADR